MEEGKGREGKGREEHTHTHLNIHLDISESLELQWYLFDFVFFLGATYALKNESHVRVDVFYKNLSPKKKAIINMLGVVFFLIPFCVVVIYFSWNYVANSWAIYETSSDEGGLPRYPIKTMIIISPILLIIQGISEFIKNLAILLNYQFNQPLAK